MKVVFFMRHRGLIRNFESVLECLVDRGHEVVLALGTMPTRWLGDSDPLHHPFVERCEGIEVRAAPAGGGAAANLSRRLRLALDYLRYLEPEYADAPKLRARARGKAPLTMRAVARVAGPGMRARIGRRLERLERSLPPPAGFVEFLDAERPDAVLVTPLVELGSPQTDVVRAARSLGIPVGFCVASWDNLTNKGLIREELDLVTVWNEAQRQEAIELHGVPPERVVATGANPYDHWFDWSPSTSRTDFCRDLGLPAEHPFVLYLGSAPFIAPDEVPFVTRWLRFLRAHPAPELRELGVLVRPHPQNAGQWSDADFSQLGPVAVHPRAGADPVEAGARSVFYDSIHHAGAVVGINTSALIESAIVGRTVHTLALPEVHDVQQGTLHFRHLLREGGGLLRVAHSFDEHADQLLASLDAGDEPANPNHSFLEAFVRPHGLGAPATPRLADAIERLGAGSAERATQAAALARAHTR